MAKTSKPAGAVYPETGPRKSKDVQHVVSNVNQRVGKIARAKSFDELPLSARIQFVSEQMAEQIFDSTMALSTIKAREIAVDPNIEHVFRVNLKYTKEMLALATKLNEFSSKQRHVEETTIDLDFSDPDSEAAELLERARAKLALVASVTNEVDEEDEDDDGRA